MMSEEKAKEDMLLWMDVETTGLDPDHDRILEVEMRCTDMRGVRSSEVSAASSD
nr:MAG TPA: oligoribonuclease [Caudoviricetes sp.]